MPSPLAPEEKAHYKTYKHGKYYNPASLHYDIAGKSEEVGCDRCDKENIAACIGWRDYDLCLVCVSEINERFEDGTLTVYSDDE